MYIEITNNCFLDIFMIVIINRLTVVRKHIRRLRITWHWPCTVPLKRSPKQPIGFFSGFVTNGLRHWFSGKGQRRKA